LTVFVKKAIVGQQCKSFKTFFIGTFNFWQGKACTWDLLKGVETKLALAQALRVVSTRANLMFSTKATLL